ncbi:hypothetical protein SeMB42_g02052 [Synchytrium endobioticum]|uniref:Uncharacterized protein n=1 Tax=Synchytrium endobioticum TaxID=286115 RepID=A0A507DH10_9FUNG|nr:hypothetical protein SeLEV6574_g01990 [Synchytrium endobioticum]TPX50962.1 hypothetical protein SeMB42_g02052 [Synchytrium endobioticum]
MDVQEAVAIVKQDGSVIPVIGAGVVTPPAQCQPAAPVAVIPVPVPVPMNTTLPQSVAPNVAINVPMPASIAAPPHVEQPDSGATKRSDTSSSSPPKPGAVATAANPSDRPAIPLHPSTANTPSEGQQTSGGDESKIQPPSNAAMEVD